MEEIFLRFRAEGRPLRITPLPGGHINRSYLVETDADRRYVLQRVNPYVFRDVGAIMENLRLLREHLRERGEPMPMIGFLDTREGRSFWRDAEGGAWRLSPYAEGCLSLLRPENAEDCFQSALAFGRFQYALRDFPAERLCETIPRFHDTPERFRLLRAAMEEDPRGRRAGLGRELAFAFEREEKASVLQGCRERGELPLRVTHNDTKISNVLLDAQTRRARCVVDLDTVMPGLAAYDFGDMVRAGASTTGEDEDGGLRPDYYAAFVCGFLAACPHLTEREKELLPLGAWTMTLECGVRFLSDYLSGDRYFRIAYPEHNLRRARAQFALAADMERKREDMQRLVFG